MKYYARDIVLSILHTGEKWNSTKAFINLSSIFQITVALHVTQQGFLAPVIKEIFS
jgi:hypothetical protein